MRRSGRTSLSKSVDPALHRTAAPSGRPLPGFDQEVDATNAGAESRPWHDLLEEYRVVRAASIALLGSLPRAAWERVGEVNGYRATPRGLAFHIAGHEMHHLRIVRERYLPLLTSPIAR